MDDKTRRVNRGPEPRTGEEFRGRADEPARSYAAPPTGNDGGDLDPDSTRRAREIENEIAHTRAEMSETIEALQERLRPSNLVADATDKVKTATTEKVRNMADTASETAQGVMRDTRERAYDIVEGTKQNPYPALLIGAGVAWMLMERGKNKGDGYRSAYRSEWRDYPETGVGSYATGDYARASSDAVYGDVDYRRQGAGRSEGIAARSMGTMHEAGDTARRTARRTQNQLQRMMRENPLLVGAAAVLVGAAVGATLPETERENELMGEARDSVVDKAQDAARGAAETVRNVAGETVGKVAQKATGLGE